MRLIQLSSTNTDFQTINFKKGLNIVLGEKASDEKKETFNGVGKTVSLSLIKYMLGSTISSCLKKVLHDDELTLNLKHNKIDYEINRKNDTITVNGKEYDSLNEFKEDLDLIFLTKELREKELTFLGLFSRFTRNSDDAYIDAISQSTVKENGFTKNKFNSYLLGLNIDYIKKKLLLITERENLKAIQSQLKALDDVKQSEGLEEIESEIQDLEENLATFQIADDYNDLNEKANSFTTEINEKRNKLYRNQILIGNKKKNLEITPDIEIDVIRKLYAEVEFFFSDIVNKRLDDVENFHKVLLKNRKNTFTGEIKLLIAQNTVLTQEIEVIDKKRASTMLLLEKKGALDEYSSISKSLELLKESKSKLLQYQELQQDFKKLELDGKIKIDIMNKDAYEYYLESMTLIQNINQSFVDIVKYIYKEHSGNIDISINSNIQAHKTYDINPKIYADGSRGINEVKIFAYDLLLYKLNPALFSFLAHDSLLYDNIDPRQTASMFELIVKEIEESNLQYFTSINENIFDNFIEKIEDKTISKSIRDSIILRLSAKNKLFKKNFDC
jgi:uncharacterized protein YydD (DUF2326 family)